MRTTEEFNIVTDATGQLSVQVSKNYEPRTMCEVDLIRSIRLLKNDLPYSEMLEALREAQKGVPSMSL